VLSANAQETNRFSPSALVVPVGTTVTWEWVDPNIGHNVVPDDGSTPAPSGSLVSGPHTYRYTFNTPGTFRYHCQAHGSPNGVGMSGTVTVVPAGT
jgi:plastocyanin